MLEPIITNRESKDSISLVTLANNPPTCTMSYSQFRHGETSRHHIHPWEHEIYIISGTGNLYCDDVAYSVGAGDGIFIPPNVDHYMINDGKQEILSRVEVNPLLAAQSGGSREKGGGTGEPPIIRHYSAIEKSSNLLITTGDGATNFVTLFNGAMKPGTSSHASTRGHTHEWEHTVYILEGQGSITCDGKDYRIKAGDGILIPGNLHHQWHNDSDADMLRITFNPISSLK